MLTRKAFLKGAGASAMLSWLRPAVAAAGRDRTLLAGVAKVKLTPAPADLAALALADPKFDHAVAQDIFARIILLGNVAGERLLLVTADLPAVPGTPALVRRIAAAHRVPPEACLFAVTGNRQADALVAGTPASAAAEAAIGAAILAGVAEAAATMQPARIALAVTTSDVNAPFGRVTPAGIADMPDFARFADKRLAVLRIDTLAGKPLALFVNYGMQSNMMRGASPRLSGDIAGAISGWVERRLGCVCAWSMAAAADTYPLTSAHLGTPVYAADGTLTIERTTLSEEVTGRLAAYLAAVQGLDILDAYARMQRFSTTFALATGERRYQAKGRSGPIAHRLRLAVVNQDIAFASVNGLPSAALGQMAREALPYRTLFLASDGEALGPVIDRETDPRGLAGRASVAADPWETERLYVDGFASLAADARKVA